VDEIPNGAPGDTDQRGQEAVVNVAWQTGGALGGAFDGPGYTPGRWAFGLARPRSVVIWRVRLLSFVGAIVLSVLTIASPIVLGLTIGMLPVVTGGLLVLAVAGWVTWGATYPAERREILRRTTREYRENRAARR
jgi:hypothetical protein